jgi:hypothetical protein
MSHKDSLRLQRQSEAQGPSPSAKARPCRVRLPTWQDSITQHRSTQSTIKGRPTGEANEPRRSSPLSTSDPSRPAAGLLKESKVIASHPFNPLPLLEQAKRNHAFPKQKARRSKMMTTPWDEGEKTMFLKASGPRARTRGSTSFPKQKDLLEKRAQLKPSTFNPLRPY